MADQLADQAISALYEASALAMRETPLTDRSLPAAQDPQARQPPPPPRSQHMAEVLEQILAEQRKTNELLGEVAQALLMAKSDSLDAARLLSQTLPVRSALPQSSHPQKPA